MKPKRRISLLVVFVCIATVNAVSDTEIGSVSDVAGTVQIDAYGTGSFIDASAGDSLFTVSIIRTSVDSSATLSINDQEVNVPADVEIRVGTLEESRLRKRKTRWLASVIGAVRNVLSRKPEDEQVATLGGRASKSEESTPKWVFDDDDDVTLFKEAKALIESGSYLEAIDRLAEIVFPPSDAFPGELPYLKGHALFSLGIYDAAVTAFAEAEEEMRAAFIPEDSSDMKVALRFEYASAEYMLGNPEKAVSLLYPIATRETVETSDELAPLIDIVYAHALLETDSKTEAKRIAERGLERYGDTEVQEEFRSILSASQ